MADGWWLGEHEELPVNGKRGSATVIPSPARRENPELARAWQHRPRGAGRQGGDPVPLDRTVTEGESE